MPAPATKWLQSRAREQAVQNNRAARVSKRFKTKMRRCDFMRGITITGYFFLLQNAGALIENSACFVITFFIVDFQICNCLSLSRTEATHF